MSVCSHKLRHKCCNVKAFTDIPAIALEYNKTCPALFCQQKYLTKQNSVPLDQHKTNLNKSQQNVLNTVILKRIDMTMYSDHSKVVSRILHITLTVVVYIFIYFEILISAWFATVRKRRESHDMTSHPEEVASPPVTSHLMNPRSITPVLIPEEPEYMSPEYVSPVGPCPTMYLPRRHFRGHRRLPSQYSIDSGFGENETHETSEVSTYNEYDMMTDDDNIQHISSSPSDHLGIPRTIVHSEDDRDSAISGRSMDYQDNRHSSGLYESNFEDYGQAEDASSESDPKENRPATLSIPSSRKITSSALASHLYRAGSSANASRRSSCSDDIYDDIDGNFTELNDKIKLLESQVILLSQSQLKNDEKQNKLKEDNALLIERVHMLEEQLREVEMRANQKIQEDKKRYRDNLAKTDNEKTLEIELLTTSLRHIEKEYQILKDEAPRLRVENEKLKRENTQLEQRLSDLQDKLHRLEDEHKDIQNRLQEEKGEMDLERQVNAQLLDELSKELDELRTYKLDTEGKGRTRSASIELPRSRRKEMEAQINVLKQNMKQLKDENEDLQAQVISSHVREGRNLVNGGTSLAQEIESLPRDELLKSLNETKDENRVLKDYIERMTLKILEKNPSILEMPITPIKTSKNKKK